MDQSSRPPNEQQRNAPAPSAARPAPAASAPPAQTRGKPAPPPVQQKPAIAQPPIATAPPRVAPATASAPAPEHLTIAPAAAQGNAQTIEFDWERAILATNRSYKCTVTTDEGQALSVSIEQGMYRRTLNGTATVKVGAIPPAPAGTSGSLTARNTVTGATATYTWQWQSLSSATAAAPPPKGGGLLSRLFGKTKSAPAPAQVKAKAKPAKTLSVAERLGSRAALAVSTQFFGQPAIGQRLAFILDKSGSMDGNRWSVCVDQLERCVRELPPHVEFAVYLFSHQTIEPRDQEGLRGADPEWVEHVIKFVRKNRPGGGTAPAEAFKRVFGLPAPPDVIYFLTDGDISGFGPEECATFRGAALTVVNTIALEGQESAEILEEIASSTGGQFMAIPDASAGAAGG